MDGVGAGNPALLKTPPVERYKKPIGPLRERDTDPKPTNTHGIGGLTAEPTLFKLLHSYVSKYK